MYFIMQIAVEGEKCVLLLMFKGHERNKNKKKKLTNAFLLKKNFVYTTTTNLWGSGMKVKKKNKERK